MAVDLDTLDSAFREHVLHLLERCADKGVTMKPYFALRDPFTQAKLWRQSRSTQTINAKIAEFRGVGADFLADCIESVGPQSGPPVTNAPPGLSWHQWGEAVDCYWLVDGEAEWSTTRKVDGQNGYHVYASLARELGLDAGLYWTSFVDPPHVQLRQESNPGKLYTLQQINSRMKEKFGQ